MDWVTRAALPTVGEVCALGTGVCDEIDGIAWQLDGLPDDADLYLRFSAPGYPDFHWSWDTGLIGSGTIVVLLPDDATANGLVEPFGITVDPTRGHVTFKAVDASVDGLAGADVVVGGVSVGHFLDADGAPDPSRSPPARWVSASWRTSRRESTSW